MGSAPHEGRVFKRLRPIAHFDADLDFARQAGIAHIVPTPRRAEPQTLHEPASDPTAAGGGAPDPIEVFGSSSEDEGGSPEMSKTKGKRLLSRRSGAAAAFSSSVAGRAAKAVRKVGRTRGPPATRRPRRKDQGEPSVLRLTLMKDPFAVMVTGEKREEFRTASRWMWCRLYDAKTGSRKSYDLVEFTNARACGLPSAPTFTCEYLGFQECTRQRVVRYSNGLEVNINVPTREDPNPMTYIVRLGKVVSMRNCQKFFPRK